MRFDLTFLFLLFKKSPKLLITHLRKRCLAIVLFCAVGPAMAEWHGDQQAIMGTVVSIQLWHEDPDLARRAIAAVMAEMHRIDAAFSPYKENSELAYVNREAARKTIAVSEELALLVDKALYFSRISDGAFDITFASLGRLYDYRAQQQPNAAQRTMLLPAINYQLVNFDKQRRLLAFNHADVQIDLGGIAKGYAVDRGVELLQAVGIRHATVSAGGDSRVLGDKRGQPWLIGVRNPRKEVDEPNSVAITIPLTDIAVSTSGDYERYFIDRASGERIHHIINPRTGFSVTGVASVTVIGPNGVDTDALSTAVFVMGVEQGLALINRLPQFDCILIDSAGRVHYSAGLASPSP